MLPRHCRVQGGHVRARESVVVEGSVDVLVEGSPGRCGRHVCGYRRHCCPHRRNVNVDVALRTVTTKAAIAMVATLNTISTTRFTRPTRSSQNSGSNIVSRGSNWATSSKTVSRGGRVDEGQPKNRRH